MRKLLQNSGLEFNYRAYAVEEFGEGTQRVPGLPEIFFFLMVVAGAAGHHHQK
jgi:hypothetical protein